jgi:hypothetical protein
MRRRPPSPAPPATATSAAPFSLATLTATTTAPLATTSKPDHQRDEPEPAQTLASLMNDVGRQRTFLMVCVMTLGWTGPVTAGLLALAVGGSGGAIVVAMGAGLGLTMAAGLGGRSLAWRRLRRAAADLDVDMVMLQQALVLVERDGIDGAVALQQVLQPPPVGPSPAA